MKYFVLMGDVIGSGKLKSTEVQTDLLKICSLINIKFSNDLRSPITITLGDEFQCIVSSLENVQKIILEFEEQLISHQVKFRVRYAQAYGTIDTEINSKIAHGMLGQALTDARKLLSKKGYNRKKVYISLDDKYLKDLLENLYEALDGLSNRWRVDDFELIFNLLNQDSDQKVASLMKKTNSQIWKRRKTLLTSEYLNIKRAILAIARKWNLQSGI